MEDYIIDANGNKRDKRTGQLIGEDKVETIINTEANPETPKKRGFNDYVKAVTKDIGTAIRNNQGGLSTGAAPLIQQKQEDQKVIDSISQQSGVPLKNMPENAPTYAEQVPEYLKDPASYDDAKAREEAAKDIIKQSEVKTETSDVGKLGSDVEEVSSEEVRDILSKLNEDKLPKNGADYLKRLWSQGAGGKAAAVGNVLGNLLGGLKWEGKGGEGGDWKKYQEDYLKNKAELEKQRDSQALNVVNQAAMNAQARQDLVAKMELALKQGGKMTPEAMRLLTIFSAAENPGADIKTGIATLLSSLNL